MYCRDCDWWKGGTCYNEKKTGEALCWSGTDNIDQLSYSYYEGGRFDTGPMFGCVHFKTNAGSRERKE